MNDALQRAIDPRAAGRAEEAIPLLADLLGHEPDNGEILCQLAWAHDHLGRERRQYRITNRRCAVRSTMSTAPEPCLAWAAPTVHWGGTPRRRRRSTGHARIS